MNLALLQKLITPLSPLALILHKVPFGKCWTWEVTILPFLSGALLDRMNSQRVGTISLALGSLPGFVLSALAFSDREASSMAVIQMELPGGW